MRHTPHTDTGFGGGLRLIALMTATIGLCLSLPGRGLPPARGETRPSPADIRKLMRDASWNQLHSMENHDHRYEYVHADIEPHDARTTLEIETSQGIAARLIRLNGQPPSEKQCQHNLARLARLASSSRLRASRLGEQQSEMSRREQLFRVLPEAFIFQYDGAEKDTGWVRVKYKPNPSFRPRTRTGAVLTGLAGTMWVDTSSRHLTKIDGSVISTVSFGWGILAKIYPGGRYLMEQKRLENGDWRTAMLQVNLRGTEMLFKRLNVTMKEVYSSYQEVPSGLTLAGAIQRLERAPVACEK